MNDIVPYKPLTYEEQYERSKKMMKELVSLSTIKLGQFKQLRDLQDQLKDRIKKQREGEKK